jgi:hypothetical protein
MALADGEVRLLDGLAGDDADARALWFTCFWSAKEAVAKADGTGLQGRPKRFVVDRFLPVPEAAAADPPATPAPLLARVSVAGAHARWVALRLLDADGAVRHTRLASGKVPPPRGRAGVPARSLIGEVRAHVAERDAAGAGYVVAWTSPEVQAAARDREARDREGAQTG